jgi:hypothetical protein
VKLDIGVLNKISKLSKFASAGESLASTLDHITGAIGQLPVPHKIGKLQLF